MFGSSKQLYVVLKPVDKREDGKTKSTIVMPGDYLSNFAELIDSDLERSVMIFKR